MIHIYRTLTERTTGAEFIMSMEPIESPEFRYMGKQPTFAHAAIESFPGYSVEVDDLGNPFFSGEAPMEIVNVSGEWDGKSSIIRGEIGLVPWWKVDEWVAGTRKDIKPSVTASVMWSVVRG